MSRETADIIRAESTEQERKLYAKLEREAEDASIRAVARGNARYNPDAVLLDRLWEAIDTLDAHILSRAAVRASAPENAILSVEWLEELMSHQLPAELLQLRRLL